jgi:hypothetical protein
MDTLTVEMKDYTDTVARLNREHFTSTLDNLRDFIDEKCEDERIYVDTRFSAVNDAVRLANNALEVRLEHLNGLYQTINKMSENFPTKGDLNNLAERYDLQVKQYNEDIRYLRESRAELSGKASSDSVIQVQANVTRNQMFVMISIAVSVISLLCGGTSTMIAVITLVLKLMGH